MRSNAPRRGSNAASLARSANILDVLDQDLSRLGLVGERRAAKLLYLVVTSRLLDRPVSVGGEGAVVGRQVLRRRDRR